MAKSSETTIRQGTRDKHERQPDFFTIWSFASVRTIDKKFLKALGKRIKGLRKSQKISQDQLAYESKMHRTHINRIENGKLEAGIPKLRAIAKALDVRLK